MKGAGRRTFRNCYGPMRTRSAITLVLLLPLAGCSSIFGGAEDPPGGRNSDDEVRALFGASVAAFNRHEVNRFMARFGADIRMQTPDGWLNGYAAVREHFAELLERFPAARMDVDSVDARRVADGAVVVRFRWRLLTGDGPALAGVGTGTYLLRGTEWEEVLEHLTPDDGAAPAR